MGFYFGDVGVYFLGYSLFMLTFSSRVKPAPGKCGYDSLLPPRRGSNRLLPAAAAVVVARLSNRGRDTSIGGAWRLLVMAFMVFHVTSRIATASPGLSPAWVDPGVEGLSVVELAREMESGRLTSERVVQAYLARIEAIDRNGPALRSVISTMPEALVVARQLDAERVAGLRRGPWHGIPILIKVFRSDSHYGLEELGSAEHTVLMTELKAGLNAYLATTPPAVKTRKLAGLSRT